MIKLKCCNCGEIQKENVLPGKHTVKATIRKLENNKNCCNNPDYQSSKGKQNKQLKNMLSDMANSLKA